MTYNDFAVRARIVNRRTDVVAIVEKKFKTAEARETWLDKQDERGVLVEVVGMSDPQ